MTAAQIALPIDNPFAAPTLPELRGSPRQIAYAAQIRDDEILTCRSIWAALDRTQGWHPVGVRAARTRHFAAWSAEILRGRRGPKPDPEVAEAEARAAGTAAIREEILRRAAHVLGQVSAEWWIEVRAELRPSAADYVFIKGTMHPG